MTQKYCSVSQFANDMGYKDETIRKKIRNGTLPAEKFGRTWRIRIPQAYEAIKDNKEHNE